MRVHLLVVWLLLCALGAAIAPARMPSFSERDPRYRLQPSDVLEIHYRYSPEFDQTVAVQPDGFVSLQLVGDFKIQGLTVDQAKAEFGRLWENRGLSELLSERIRVMPNLSYRRARINVAEGRQRFWRGILDCVPLSERLRRPRIAQSPNC